MNGNSQNNYRGGWNNMPSTDFSQGQIPHGIGHRAFADNRHIPHQMLVYYADNRHVPHQMPAHYVDNRNVSHQTPAHYVDNRHLSHQTLTDNRHLPHPMPTYYADNRHLRPHPMLTHYVDNRHLPYQMPTHYADKRHPPHQTVENCTDNRHLPHQAWIHYEDKLCLPPHQTTKDLADKRHLPNQNPEDYAANKCLPHKTPDHYADKRPLPHQKPEAYADDKCLSHQMSQSYADKNLSQQTPKDCADKNLPQQTPKDCADKKCLPQQPPKDCADKECLPQQTPKDCADKKCLPQQTPKDCADKKCLPQQTPKDRDDKKCLPQQTPKDYADKKCLPQQTPEDCANKKCLPPLLHCEVCDLTLNPKCMKSHNKGTRHRIRKLELREQSMKQQTPEDCVYKNLSQQTPKDCADKKCLPQQTPEDCANKKCEICDLMLNPKSMEIHIKGMRHRRRVLELHEQAMKHKTSNGEEIKHNRSSQIREEACVDNKCLPHRMSKHYAVKKDLTRQTPKDFANKRPLPHQKPEAYADSKCLPHQTSEHYANKNSSQQTPEDNANKECLPPMMQCEVCDVKFNPKCMESHNNGKKHQRRLLELREKSKKHKTSNGEESRHIRSSKINRVVQPKKVPRFKDHTGAKDHDFKVENVKNETSSFKKKNVPAEMSKRKVRDNGFKHEIEGATGAKYMKLNNGIRRFAKSSELEDNALSNSVKFLVQIPELTRPSGSVASSKIAPVLAEGSSFKLQSQHVAASLSQESKGKEYHKFQNTTVEKNDQPQSTSVELNASASSNIIAETESISSDFAATVTRQGPGASHVITPPAVGSSFEPKNHIDSQREVTEAKEHHEVQKCGVETNDKPQSISMELQALGCGNISTMAGDKISDINTSIEGTCSDSGAITIAPLQSPIASQVSTPVAVIQTGMSDSEVHNEIQNHIVDSNNQQHSISMELHDAAGSMTNNQTKVVNSDSTAKEIYMEPLASLPPDTVGSSFEPVTEHGLDTETEPHVSKAIYIESQHPAEETDIELLPPVLMEIDEALEVSAETEIKDGSSQAAVKMDAYLSPESGKTKLPKVSVCLTCGDEGFEEAIVYCSKCGDYAMHRYCLAGPVVYTDKVTWFCEDCEEVVVEADRPNSETPESKKDEVVDPQPIADPIWRGSLQVFNKSFDKITSLMGYLSTLACPKVLEETRHLPDVLYANLLQRSAVWPESFKKFGTNNQSIGLYFFPENERAERYFDQLVDDMVSNDLAIRVMVEKAELLIFPSTLLPRQYERFQSKYFLWGIFKRKQAASTIKDT